MEYLHGPISMRQMRSRDLSRRAGKIPAGCARITQQETIDANIAKLSKRYEGLQYSDKSAQLRADKQDERNE
jgi:hypothetical protein